jgi:hypothetical protein
MLSHQLKSSDVAFCHRPKLGVSVGAAKIDGLLVIAAAFTNDGLSFNGHFHSDKCDSFSRKIARQIILGRLEQGRNDTAKLTLVYKTDMNARTFMSKFRAAFKPDPEEADDVLNDVLTMSTGVQYRARKTPTNIWDTIHRIARETLFV